MAAPFDLEIITPEREFFHGPVEMLIIQGSDGEIGILHGHMPLVSLVEIGQVRFLTSGQWRNAFVSEGFLKVRPDGTVLHAQTAEWPEEIDINRALAAKARAEERILRKESLQEYTKTKTTLARAMTRLRVARSNIRMD